MLFSNGAIAGAAAVPDEALDRLADVSRVGAAGARARSRPTPPPGLAAAVAEGVRRPQGWPDDVAVLVAHRRETALEPLQLDLVATPSVLPGVRRRLGSWLAGLGMGEQDRVGVMVAVGEACANAAEHAYRGGEPGPDVGLGARRRRRRPHRDRPRRGHAGARRTATRATAAAGC